MLVIILILLLLVLILSPSQIEYFYTTTNIPVATADPLELNTQHIVDPTGWRWDSDNTITTTIKIKAITGQLEFQSIMEIPSLGYHQDSGLQYSSWNKIQGTNGWDYMNEARHGHGWFWWQPTVDWQNKTDLEKSKELELKLVLNNTDKKPEFPVSFGLKIHDFNYNNVLRFWLTFTRDPFLEMPHLRNQKAVSTHTLAPPLMLKSTNIRILPSDWKMKDNIATVKVPLIAQQGGIDWTRIVGNEKGPSNKWFSWNINHKSHLHGPITINIFCKINNNYDPPKHFPAFYNIIIKDKHMQRHIIVQLEITENPYTSLL